MHDNSNYSITATFVTNKYFEHQMTEAPQGELKINWQQSCTQEMLQTDIYQALTGNKKIHITVIFHYYYPRSQICIILIMAGNPSKSLMAYT